MGFSEFIDTSTHRCPVVLMVDTSRFMPAKAMSALFTGVRSFSLRLAEEDISGTKVEPAIITFGDEVQMVQDFISSDSLSMPAFEAVGNPCLGQSIDLGLSLIDGRTKFYARHNIEYHKPWLFLISSGVTAEVAHLQTAALKAQEADLAGKLSYFIVGMPGADMGMLREIASPFNPPLQMKEACFENLFSWLNASMHRVHEVQAGAGYLASPVVAHWAKEAGLPKTN